MVVTTGPIIQLRNLTLNYGGNDIVRNIDLDIEPGETKVVLGPSGVGKSTILKAILGLLKPSEGKIFIHGMEISNLREHELVKIRLKMAMVFQQGALFDSMTVWDNVSYRLREHNLMEDNSILKRVQDALQFVGLEGVLNLKPAQLSGGMRKRVAIARALASEPEIFLFDEPTVGLDPINHHNVEQLILKLKAKGYTLIVVTHDVESAFRLADTIVMLHAGQFIFNGEPEELKKSNDLRIRHFLNPAELIPTYKEQ